MTKNRLKKKEQVKKSRQKAAHIQTHTQPLHRQVHCNSMGIPNLHHKKDGQKIVKLCCIVWARLGKWAVLGNPLMAQMHCKDICNGFLAHYLAAEDLGAGAKNIKEAAKNTQINI